MTRKYPKPGTLFRVKGGLGEYYSKFLDFYKRGDLEQNNKNHFCIEINIPKNTILLFVSAKKTKGWIDYRFLYNDQIVQYIELYEDFWHDKWSLQKVLEEIET